MKERNIKVFSAPLVEGYAFNAALISLIQAVKGTFNRTLLEFK